MVDHLARAISTEIKFVKSAKDVGILLDKFPFGVRRLMGRYANGSTVPPSLQIEPTNVRNAACISCPREKMRRKKGYMELSLFHQIINDATHCGVRRIHLYLHGEPLLHPHIIEMIAYLKRSRLNFNLATNGMLFTRDFGEAILKCGLDS
jgi:MoaA/NifB/PqqE/SkfB family radical SAM enzyme